MPDFISLKIVGLGKLIAKFDKWPREIRKNMERAGKDAANEILRTEGVQRYPPETTANRPPAPFYIRGRGTQYASGRNTGTSENLGKKWVTEARGYNTRLSNIASYAKWLHSDKLQARAMGRIGWRKIFKVAREKLPQITKIFQGWVDFTIRKLEL